MLTEKCFENREMREKNTEGDSYFEGICLVDHLGSRLEASYLGGDEYDDNVHKTSFLHLSLHP